jgi:hypothetical protein
MSDKAVEVTRSALKKLLNKAERAWAQQAAREHTLVFSEASFPEYFRLPRREDKDAAHAFLRNLERSGTISIGWDRRAGDDGQIVRLRLINADALAQELNEKPAWTAYQEAEQLLSKWAAIPNIAPALNRWRMGKLVRSMSPDRVNDFIDACRVIEACESGAESEDTPIRRLSAKLFSDSKRIEAIGPALDVLTAESIDIPWRDLEDVFASMGLVKLPQPVLLSGQGSVELTDGTRLPIASPYIGLPPQSIKRVVLDEGARYIFSVENLTTFHELALGKAGSVCGLLMYTAGMPSPSLLRVYRQAMEEFLSSPNRERFHWGDIDLGGFRIAACLARKHSSPLRLWCMDPSAFREAPARKQLTLDEVREIKRIAAIHGWDAVADNVAIDGRAIEQEVLPLRLPTLSRAECEDYEATWR